jgi:hypothetical protein
MWKDKCPVLLISTHANPIGFPCVPHDEVPRRNGPVREKIPTSPMLVEYTTFMRGVDVADQLRGEKLVREQGTGSKEQGFHLQIFWNFDDHGEADLLPWIINVWTFIK